MITSIIVFLFGPDLHDFCMALDFCYLHASPLPVHSSLCIKILLRSDKISIFRQLKISEQDEQYAVLQIISSLIDYHYSSVRRSTVNL